MPGHNQLNRESDGTPDRTLQSFVAFANEHELLWRAGRAGTHIGTLCNLIYNQLGEPGVRRVLGVLSLTKKFGLAAVEDACAAALEMGVHEYRFVRRYLERGPQLTLRQVDPLIRELVQYRDLINLRTQEPEQ